MVNVWSHSCLEICTLQYSVANYLLQPAIYLKNEQFNIKNDQHKFSFHFFINMKENMNRFNSKAFITYNTSFYNS